MSFLKGGEWRAEAQKEQGESGGQQNGKGQGLSHSHFTCAAGVYLP